MRSNKADIAIVTKKISVSSHPSVKGALRSGERDVPIVIKNKNQCFLVAALKAAQTQYDDWYDRSIPRERGCGFSAMDRYGCKRRKVASNAPHHKPTDTASKVGIIEIGAIV